jgi:hypothetical protein
VPTATTVTALLDKACAYLAGASYDATNRWYPAGAAPPIPYVYIVKRAYPKDWNARNFVYGAPVDSQPVGALAMVVLGDTGAHEQRIAVAGASGIKKVMVDMEIRCHIRANTAHAEDVEDAIMSIVDGMLARIRADKTMGSGGFETGGFQVAETAPWLAWRRSKVESTAGISKAYLVFMTEAHYYVQA